MAGVSTKISVLDAATPAIEHMYRGVSQLISGMYKLNEASSNAVDMGPFLEAQKSMAEALAVQKQLVKNGEEVSDKYKKIKDDTEQANNAQKAYNNSLSAGVSNATAFGDKLTSGIKRYITMAATAFGGKQLIDASDTWINNSSRLGLLTNGLQEQKMLQQEIYQSALKSRGAYNDTVNVIAKLGLLAPDAFVDNSELVKFTELMNKSFKLSGASTEEKTSAMYQLTQAMASGRLQGDEFRSIIENAPMLANAIAEYTGVSKGELKDLSSDGAISADIIKNALFGAADDIESKFSQLPMTFGDAWTNIGSSATMAFAPLYEQMNGMLNNDIVQGVLQGVPELLEKASLKAQELMSVIDGSLIVGSTGFDDIANSVGNITNAMFSANGVVGTFIRTIGNIVANPATAKSLAIMGSGFLTVAGAINTVLEVATPLAPTIAGIYVGLKMYKTATPIISSVTNGMANFAFSVNNARTKVISLVVAEQAQETAANGAAVAQKTLNTAMKANPYLGVASAIAKVVSMMLALVGTIKAVKSAADLVSDSTGTESELTAIDYAKKNGVSLSTARSIVSSNESYDKQIDDLKKRKSEIKSKAADIRNKIETPETDSLLGMNVPEADISSIFSLDKVKQNAANSENINKLKEYDKENSELNAKIAKLAVAKLNQEKTYKENEKQQSTVNDELNKISTDPNDYYKEFDNLKDFNKNLDVDNVENVNHINDTVDIASEDLRYIRDIADQEAINNFTSKLLQPQINVSFGEVKETVDVDKIIERITTGLDESLNNSSDLLHI